MSCARLGLRTAVVAALLAALACATAEREGGARARPAAPAAGAGLPAADEGTRPVRLVLVSIEGLPGDAVAADEAPQLAALGRAGIVVEAVQPVFPAVAAAAHTTLVTGSGPVRHGVVSERAVTDAGVGAPERLPASAVRAATLWQAVMSSGAPVALLDWPASASAAVTELLPEPDPTRLGQPEAWLTGATARAADAARRAGGEAAEAAVPGPVRDAVLTQAACELLESQLPPKLLLLRLSGLAAAQERSGPGSAAARAALAEADLRVAALVACLSRAGRLAETAFVVTGDRGPMPAHTAIHPNVRLAEVGLVTPKPRGAGVLRWDALARSNGGSAFVYARQADLAVLARRALEETARETGVFRVVSAEELLARGADPQAWFGLDARPGWVFGDNVDGPLVTPAPRAAAGGYDGSEPRMATGLVAWGPGLRSGLRVPELRQVDVAPTLARWLGVELPDADGRAVVGLLRPPPPARVGARRGR